MEELFEMALECHPGERRISAVSSGGIGTVYRAVRDDSEYQKPVAINVIRLLASGATVLAG